MELDGFGFELGFGFGYFLLIDFSLYVISLDRGLNIILLI